MRIYLFAILGLLIMEALLLPRAIRDFKTMQRMRAEKESKPGLPLVVGPFTGYDADGRPLKLATENTRWIVPIVIHSNRISSDLDYLSQLRSALPIRSISLFGVCDQGRCGQIVSEFPILAYGSYAPLRDIVRLDDENQILVLNQNWSVRKALQRAPSPSELAAGIREAIGQ